MTKLQKFCALLILFSLISCDDQASKPAATAQDFPQFDSFQSPSEIDQLKARLFDNPEDFEALSTLGDRYFEAGRYLEAIQTNDKALAVKPMCADCLNDRGLAQYYMGDPKSALESFDKAIAIDPKFANPWLSKGFVLTSEGRYQEAVAPLNKVKQLDPGGQLALAADNFLAMGTQNGVR